MAAYGTGDQQLGTAWPCRLIGQRARATSGTVGALSESKTISSSVSTHGSGGSYVPVFVLAIGTCECGKRRRRRGRRIRPVQLDIPTYPQHICVNTTYRTWRTAELPYWPRQPLRPARIAWSRDDTFRPVILECK